MGVVGCSRPTVCCWAVHRVGGMLGERVGCGGDELQQVWKSEHEVSDSIEALWAQGGICETTGDS